MLLRDVKGIWSGLSLQKPGYRLLEGKACGRHLTLDAKQIQKKLSLLECTCQYITLFQQITSMLFWGKQEMDRWFAFVYSCGQLDD